MHTSDFDYILPQELIAQIPVEPRDSSRLLVLGRADGAIAHGNFLQLTQHLRPGDLLVFNDSRVIPARVYGYRADTGGAFEILLLRRLKPGIWNCLGKPGRRLRPGARLKLHGNDITVSARVTALEPNGSRIIEIEDDSVLEKIGTTPLPPYIREPLQDPERYQTVYGRVLGSVAAPTAGLHFTPNMLQRLQAMKVEMTFVTLHVGPGTFRPVQSEDPRQHTLDAEYFELNAVAAGAINRAKTQGRRVICIGTTAVRIVETAAKRVMLSEEGLGSTLLPLQPGTGWTELMVLEVHQFRITDGLLTNFHIPRSTLLMLVCAFAGQKAVLAAYQEAVLQRYRFYSFGDAMLII
jgi:S-adenosylmethionine:tRNA ribosyltransferase-isomerase